MNKEQFQKIMEEVKAQTKKQAISIHVNMNRVPELTDSKFGGMPYWDNAKEYPKSSNGDKLIMIAQINFAQYKFGDMFPEKGILQFFIGLDDMWGMDFDQQDIQDGFRVVYHEMIDPTVTVEDVAKLEIPCTTDEEQGSPVNGQYAIEFEKEDVSVEPNNDSYDAYFFEQAEKLGIEVDEDKTVYELGCEIYGDEEYDEMMEESCECSHRMLGYPFFTQSDPREMEKKYRYYDTLLFQMDSDWDDENEFILWGDAGVGNFFINQEDLKKHDFSKVLYNWDCH